MSFFLDDLCNIHLISLIPLTSLSYSFGIYLVGLMIGSGIFASPGPVLMHTQSVGASLLIWLAAGVMALLGSVRFICL